MDTAITGYKAIISITWLTSSSHWHLDTTSDGIVQDSSRNANHGNVIGGTLVPGYISNCLSFDKLDDYINCGYTPSMNIRDAITMYAWLKVPAFADLTGIISRNWRHPYSFYLHIDKLAFAWTDVDGTFNYTAGPLSILTPGTWQLAGVTWQLATNYIEFYIGDTLTNTILGSTKALELRTDPLVLGARTVAGGLFGGLIDEPTLLSRHFTKADFTRVLERRYP